jgi:hypothetical protein
MVFPIAAVRPITSQAWEALGQYIQCVKLWVIFMFVCSPYYFPWLSKISITLDSGTENVLWTPEAYILFYFYYFLWWLHYSLMPEFLPKLFSSFFSILLFAFSIYLFQLHRSKFIRLFALFFFCVVNGSQTSGCHSPVKLLPSHLPKRRD